MNVEQGVMNFEVGVVCGMWGRFGGWSILDHEWCANEMRRGTNSFVFEVSGFLKGVGGLIECLCGVPPQIM